jgi:hypothetical protein
VERCKHVKSRATTVYFKLGTLRRVSTYVQHVWGIIGHVTAEAGNTVGTDGAPPQYDIIHIHNTAPCLDRTYLEVTAKFSSFGAAGECAERAYAPSPTAHNGFFFYMLLKKQLCFSKATT